MCSDAETAHQADSSPDVLIVDTRKDLNAYKWMFSAGNGQSGCCGEPEAGKCGNTSGSSDLTEEDLMKFEFNDWAGKLQLRTLQI